MYDKTAAPRLAVVILLGAARPAVTIAEEGAAPGGAPLSLSVCWERVQARNPALQAAGQRRAAAEERARQAGALPNPRLSAEAENFGGAGAYGGWESAETTYAISQEIELGGKRGARIAEAEAEAALAEAEHASLERDLFRDTRLAFSAVALGQERLRLAAEAVRIAEDVERTTAARVSAGRTTPLESDRVLVETALRRADEERTRRELASARRRLASLWGEGEAVFGNVQEAPSQTVLEVPPLEELLARSAANPDARRARALVDLSQMRLRREEASRLSNLELSAGVRRFEETGDDAFVAVAAIELPLWNRNSSGIRAAAAESEAARLQESAVQLGIESELRQTHDRLRGLAAFIEAIEAAALPAAERGLAAARAGYREGKFTYLEVLDAQRVYQGARLESVAAREEVEECLAHMERLAGFAPSQRSGE